MVNGVHGHVDHVVKHVVMEPRVVLGDVIILHPVEELIVLAQMLMNVYAL